MLLKDDIYGEEEITEEVLIDLINSNAVQRLKGISQMGMPREYWHYAVFSRYEHSIGVLILLRRMGADIEEQIAGLLHDISHTAFSHVIDWVIGDATKEDYQDRIHEEMIKKSDIPDILRRCGFNYRKIVNLDSFSLLERHAPYLCADRVDYTLREEFANGRKNNALICFNDLISRDGKILFKTELAAQKFAEVYMFLQTEHWAGIEARARYYILAQVLKNALQAGLISEDDFTKNDSFILNILEQSQTEEILNGLALLKKGFIFLETEEGVELKKKFRFVDPELIVDGQVVSLSLISEEYRAKLEQEKKNSNKCVKIIIQKK